MRKIFLCVSLVFLLFLSISVFAYSEMNNTIGSNVTSGQYGSTVAQYCNASSVCSVAPYFDYVCYLDSFDSQSGVASEAGWCFMDTGAADYCYNHTSLTAAPAATTHSALKCKNSTHYRSCSDGIWSALTAAATGYTCVGDILNSTGAAGDDDDGSPGGGDDDDDDDDDTNSLSITSYPNDFDLTQGENTSKVVIVENDGETNLTTLILSLSGIDSSYYTVIPTSFSSIDVGESKTFVVEFLIPLDATVNTYLVTLTASSGTTSDTATFNLRIMPSNETVENVIIPQYENYTSFLVILTDEIDQLETEGKNVTEIRGLYDQLSSKLTEVNTALESEDYFLASQLLADAENIITDIKVKMEELGTIFDFGDIEDWGWVIFIIAIIILVAVIITVTYLFRPKGEGYYTGEKGKGLGSIFSKLKGVDSVGNIAKKIKRKRKREKDGEKEEKFKYEFKR
ncbi:hypothetical protein ACFLQN_04160 [Candidatus Aenigmatarchaeota archaeon]